MTKTQCNKCIFSAPVSSTRPCEFNVPDKIRNSKQIEIVDDYYELNNYRCLYGFSSNQYENNKDSLNKDQIINHIKENTNLRYYLFIDARNVSLEDFKTIIDTTNSLSLKPKYVSIIVEPELGDSYYQYIRHNLSCRKWKMLVYIQSSSLNDCINSVLDTSLIESESWCVLFVDANRLLSSPQARLQKIVDRIQDIFIVKQLNFIGVKADDSLHLLCLNCDVYKLLVSSIDRDILSAIKNTPEINLAQYETN